LFPDANGREPPILGSTDSFRNRHFRDGDYNGAMSRPTPTGDEDAQGVLIVGHGTREAAGIAEFLDVVRQTATRLAPLPVEAGFLELAEPTIAAGVDRLHERGVRRISVVPLLLFAAAHARRDIPETVATATARHPGLSQVQVEHLGLDPRIVDLSQRRYDEATTGDEVADGETLLLVVGRGSSDESALAEFAEFVRLRIAGRAYGRVDTAFCALAEPRLTTALERAAATPFRRVVVQPHLLFAGELIERIGREVAATASANPGKLWRIAAHLGPHPGVVEAIVQRVATSAAAKVFG
jgi:sirohydrochlorin cobaltochelatase